MKQNMINEEFQWVNTHLFIFNTGEADESEWQGKIEHFHIGHLFVFNNFRVFNMTIF